MRRTPLLLGIGLAWTVAAVHAANPLLGEVELKPSSKVERDAGVWLDGQYVGFVKDLRGKRKLVLVPGEHALRFRLVGYRELRSSIVVEPGGETVYRISMQPDPTVAYPSKAGTARLRLSVEPEDAAVFVNRSYVGHVDQFDGRAGMRLAPGTYRFTIALPGYRSFETELTLRAEQDYEIKTELAEGSLDEQAGVLKADPDETRATAP